MDLHPRQVRRHRRQPPRVLPSRVAARPLRQLLAKEPGTLLPSALVLQSIGYCRNPCPEPVRGRTLVKMRLPALLEMAMAGLMRSTSS